MARPANPDSPRLTLLVDPARKRRWLAAAAADERDLTTWLSRALDAAADSQGIPATYRKATRGRKNQ